MINTAEKVLPEGYKQNAQGGLTPISKIKPIDIDRDELISELFSIATVLRQKMLEFKNTAMGDVLAFVDLVAEKYDAKIGGKKGNITLVSFDGCQKISIQVSDHLAFDERIHVAKALIDECLHAWTSDASDNVKVLIDHAFQTDKQGQLNTGRILSLLRLDITDDKWTSAMEALKDSIKTIGSSSYIRFYHRPNPEAKWQNLSLDMAAL